MQFGLNVDKLREGRRGRFLACESGLCRPVISLVGWSCIFAVPFFGWMDGFWIVGFVLGRKNYLCDLEDPIPLEVCSDWVLCST